MTSGENKSGASGFPSKSSETGENAIEQNVSLGEPSGIDNFLQRLAYLSQFLLLALGVFGYFYTVVPVFQNQQLQEQAAKLEIEKNAAERQLDSLIAKQITVKEEIQLLQKEWDRERVRSSQLADETALARKRESEARRQSDEANNRLQEQLGEIDAVRWKLLLLDFSFNYFNNRTGDMVKDFETEVGLSFDYFAKRMGSKPINQNAESDKELGGFILSAESEWPKPYDDLMSAVEEHARKAENLNGLPESYYLELKELIRAKETKLHCNKPDFASIRTEYLAEIAALNSVIDAELESYLEGLKKQYAGKWWQSLEITDDFRSSSRNIIVLDRVTVVDKAYRKKLSDLRRGCADVGLRVLVEITKEKVVTQ